MRILGIDFGGRNIGLALSDSLHITAQPLNHYLMADEEKNRNYFSELIRKYDIGEIVIGMPFRMDGSQGRQAQITREFASWLEKTLQVPVFLWDERLTTQQAISIMQEQKIKSKSKKKVEHQISATIILQSYLENRRGRNHERKDT